MKAICLYFQIHQPYRLKRYRFFDIGNDHYYYDDFTDDDIITRVARQSYIPAAETLLRMIRDSKGAFKCSLSISGVVLEQCEVYVPEFVDLLKQLADTGCVEFLAQPYGNSLASLIDPEEFERSVREHGDKLGELFGVKPTIFHNTEMVYSDDIAPMIAAMGYKGAVTEGAKHILGWKSPDYIYTAASAPQLKLLLRNAKLSEDIAYRFSDTSWSEYPLTADKYMGWIADTPREEQVFNIFMNIEVLGGSHPRQSGIFDFFEALPRFAAERGVEFMLPHTAVRKIKPVSELSVMHPISWADEACDVSAWLGNQLQNEAFHKLYSVSERVRLCDDRRLRQDWNYLQSADHLFYMSTKRRSDGALHALFSPYDTPFDAFTNYMNVLADFIVRVEEQFPLSIENEELNSLLTTIRNQAREIESLNKEVATLRLNKEHLNEEHALRQPKAEVSEAEAPAKAPKAEKAPKTDKPKRGRKAAKK